MQSVFQQLENELRADLLCNKYIALLPFGWTELSSRPHSCVYFADAAPDTERTNKQNECFFGWLRKQKSNQGNMYFSFLVSTMELVWDGQVSVKTFK